MTEATLPTTAVEHAVFADRVVEERARLAREVVAAQMRAKELTETAEAQTAAGLLLRAEQNEQFWGAALDALEVRLLAADSLAQQVKLREGLEVRLVGVDHWFRVRKITKKDILLRPCPPPKEA